MSHFNIHRTPGRPYTVPPEIVEKHSNEALLVYIALQKSERKLNGPVDEDYLLVEFMRYGIYAEPVKSAWKGVRELQKAGFLIEEDEGE